VIAHLEEAPLDMAGVPPLLLFVNDLAEYVTGAPATAIALGEWTNRVAERFGLDREKLRRPRRGDPLPAGIGAGSGAGGRDTYLVIECRPDGADFDRFLVTAWLQFAGEPGIMLRCDEEPLPLGRLPALIEALLVEDARVVSRDNPDLTIEFVLPRGLLNQPFDQFRISVAGFPRRLGIEYPVVMRSLDRLRHHALRHNWRRKWERLRDDPANATVRWVTEPGEYDDERLFTLLSDHASVGLAMAFPPRGGEPEAVDELWVGLQAGAPIVTWCRDGRDPEGFGADARALLDSDLLSLPQKVRELRRKAVLSQRPGEQGENGRDPGERGRGTQEHLGLHLALVFDDADRVPEPYVRLKPPA
jgi:hypothetical protein